ncbi:AraC-like DNA-binding protein [Actinoplanes octamycinicus]|uniref:AraC-like DNA-binding protein n=1 Tax=Actinoplanes octamycinicus TaxID=135948 RepID=A0A7W7M9K6_9ACTN|nr:helix-turn-helix domain-containing protein [Actinoplanes octamycinicus]MBB4742022.1 AraC-like DNA-binding protein [Actinoplanes octamycinicus]GIE60785.1 AraC family transcriptional regulator [Actinoplanes octamycinicus]
MPAILHPRAGQQKFRFGAPAAAPALRPFVAHYWTVTWDLRGQAPYEQQVLPYPAVNMTFKPGRCRVAGVPRGRFTETLHDAGRVFGVRFHPGGFHPFLRAPVSSITGRFLAIEDIFGTPGQALADAILAADDEAAVTAMNDFLAARAPDEPDPAAELAATVVARTAAEPGITRVDDLADAFDLTMRQLQRLFATYVGVSPKWVIRRHRLHEAAARAAAGTRLDLGALAAELGYSDQAHLTRDFAAMVGVPPAQYVRAQ